MLWKQEENVVFFVHNIPDKFDNMNEVIIVSVVRNKKTVCVFVANSSQITWHHKCSSRDLISIPFADLLCDSNI